MKELLRYLERWLHTSYDFMNPKAISAFRIFFALALLIFGQFNFSGIVSKPTSLYKPKGSLAIWLDFPSVEIFIGLEYLFLAALVFLLFGFKTKWSSVMVGLIIIVTNSFKYSFGKIDHGMLFITIMPLIMAFSNWGRFYSVDEKLGNKEDVKTWPIALISLVIGFGMFTAGIQKLMGGWLKPNIQAIKFHLFKSYLNFREGPLTDFFVGIQSKFLWEVMDYTIVLFELGFLLATLRTKVFQVWIIFALLFHIGVFLVLDITFSNNAIAYFLFLDWVIIISVLKVGSLLNWLNRILTWQMMIIALIGLVSFKIYLGTPYLAEILELGRFERSISIFALATSVVIITLIYRCVNWKKERA